MMCSTAPQIKIFEVFQKNWTSIRKNEVENCINQKSVQRILTPSVRKGISGFVRTQLAVQQPREDYKELLNLCLVFIGEKPVAEIRAPGALSKARWMMRLIYSLKICIFRSQVGHLIEEHKIEALMQFSAFIVKIYIRHWYQCQSSILAPLNDMHLLKELKNYEQLNSEISTATFATFSNHLWDLSEQLSPLALFDDRVPTATLRSMVTNRRVVESTRAFKMLPA